MWPSESEDPDSVMEEDWEEERRQVRLLHHHKNTAVCPGKYPGPDPGTAFILTRREDADLTSKQRRINQVQQDQVQEDQVQQTDVTLLSPARAKEEEEGGGGRGGGVRSDEAAGQEGGM